MSVKKHQKVFDQVFDRPRRYNVLWSDIEKLIIYLGGEVDKKRRGSRVGITLPLKDDSDSRPVVGIFHEPHPEKETDKGALDSLEKLLTSAGYCSSDKI